MEAAAETGDASWLDAQDLAAMRRREPDLLRAGGLNSGASRAAGLGFQAWARAGRWLALIGPGEKPLAGRLGAWRSRRSRHWAPRASRRWALRALGMHWRLQRMKPGR
ncbi:hypothetical protein CCMA1212_001742 [Trichoderma ghanense]|uniref:Uncharacterized protein n=1 Tax=Trichoderma ghanense TaxID=65468 RepID=A0ABY2HBP0_9HYPO